MNTSDILAGLPLDRDSPTPLFRQLYTQVREAILRGVLTPGMQLPPTRALCVLLSVSRQTVLNAYDQLFAEGFLSGTVGKGTFISSHLPISARASAPRGLMRPLSQRGADYARAMKYVGHHTAIRPAMGRCASCCACTCARRAASTARRNS